MHTEVLYCSTEGIMIIIIIQRHRELLIVGDVCYVCMVITYSRVWINRVRLPIPLVVS